MKKYIYDYAVVKNVLDRNTDYEFSKKMNELNIRSNSIIINIDKKENNYLFEIFDEDNNLIISFKKTDDVLAKKMKELNVLKNIVRIVMEMKNDEFIRFSDGTDPDVTIFKQHSLKSDIVLIGNGHEFQNVITLSNEDELDFKNIFVELINNKNFNDFPNLLNIKIYVSPVIFTRMDQELAKLPYVFTC